MGNWLVNYSQLIPFGITEQHVHFIIGFLGVIICYYLLYPIIKLLMLLNWNRVLTYFIGSFLLLITFGTLKLRDIVNGREEEPFVNLANVALGIVFFGGTLIVYHIAHTIVIQIKSHSSKST
ncbi:hypothetical protein GH741_04170 [Aquibacillus halophilus]|uniref:Uncharacterized protein n=1 Tax=Aquibacillus halophilus TaxID=930132 RepID=A0A6A8D8F3_9BACI|nr:hypothetical protein [Aquibacillus halophilus]MRH41868.1 hypothetical protein [Aquibacillus halophilus]